MLHQWFASSCNTSEKRASHHRRACFSKNTALVSRCICIMYPHIFLPTSSTTSLAQATRAFTRDAKRSISSLGSPLSVVKTFWLQLLGRLSKATGLVKGGIFRRSLVIWRVKHLQTKGSLWLDGQLVARNRADYVSARFLRNHYIYIW